MTAATASGSTFSGSDGIRPRPPLPGIKPLDLASVLKNKIQPAFPRLGITGLGWHILRHSPQMDHCLLALRYAELFPSLIRCKPDR